MRGLAAVAGGVRRRFRGQTLHIWKSRKREPRRSGRGQGRRASDDPGRRVTTLKALSLVVACGDGNLELLEVQLEGRKRMAAADFANGQRLTENESLGERTVEAAAGISVYAATYAGIRQVEKDDLALIVSGLPAMAAAVFTQNRVQAAPVRLCRRTEGVRGLAAPSW